MSDNNKNNPAPKHVKDESKTASPVVAGEALAETGVQANQAFVAAASALTEAAGSAVSAAHTTPLVAVGVPSVVVSVGGDGGGGDNDGCRRSSGSAHSPHGSQRSVDSAPPAGQPISQVSCCLAVSNVDEGQFSCLLRLFE